MNKEIMIQLIEMLNTYQKENKLLDEFFYKRLIELYSEKYDMKDYLGEVIVINKSNIENPKYAKYTEGLAGLLGQASYEFETGNVIIYMDNLEYNAYFASQGTQVSKENEITFKNIFILQSILHELEHAIQEKQLKEGNDLESELLKSIHSTKSETNLSYDYSIFERLAELKSLSYILEMLPYLNVDEPKIVEYYEQKKAEALKLGYDFISKEGYITTEGKGKLISPTEHYINITDCDKERARELLKQFVGEDRYYYGLPISLEEYKSYVGDSTKTLS